jgi:Calx-beta domain
VQDVIDEDIETIVVAIASVINGTAAGSPATVSITDDDAPPSVTLRLGTTLIEEGDSTALTATLSARSGRDVTVNLAFSGTAALTADYTRDGTSIIIPAGSLSRTIALTAVPDAIDEVTETVVVGITSVTNAIAAGSLVTVRIVDVNPTPTVTLRVSGTPMAEAGGLAVVTATLSGRSSRAVTVNLGFAGTAGLTTDYTRSATAIIIPAGSFSRTMTLTAVPDTIDEVAETIVVRIASVTNAIAAGSPVTASITDDDVSLAIARGLVHGGDAATR